MTNETNNFADRSPLPEKVEWNTPVAVFAEDNVAWLEDAQQQAAEYDFWGGKGNRGDVMSEGVHGIPKLWSKKELPNGTVVEIIGRTESRQRMDMDLSDGIQANPWPYDVVLHAPARGGYVTPRIPMIFEVFWTRPDGSLPEPVAVFTSDGQDRTFVTRQDEDDEAPEFGALQPDYMPQGELVICTVSGDPHFARGLAVMFPEPSE